MMGDLPEQRPDDVTILDLEASIEHLTRGTLRNVDALLVVTEPYYRSLETAARIVPLAQELMIPKVWIVANKVRTERDATAIREFCTRHGFNLLAVIPFDDRVTEADNLGRPILDHAADGAAVTALAALATRVEQELGSLVPAIAGGSGDAQPSRPPGCQC